MQPNEASSLLTEVQSKVVSTGRLDNRLMLGHAVLKILIDILAATQHSPSSLWRDTLLAIGGDPRVPITHPDYSTWWAPLGQHYIQLMIQWLSEFDMELFLSILQDFARGHPDMERMYPDREKFLRGLFNKKLVHNTRLYLGRHAEEFIQRNCHNKYRPKYTFIKDASDLVVFYLNLGKAHLVEGSFSFTLRVFDELPTESPFTSYPREVSRYTICQAPEYNYEKQFGNRKNEFFHKTHQGTWQPDVVHALRKLGIDIREDDVMTRSAFMRSYR